MKRATLHRAGVLPGILAGAVLLGLGRVEHVGQPCYLHQLDWEFVDGEAGSMAQPAGTRAVRFGTSCELRYHRITDVIPRRGARSAAAQAGEVAVVLLPVECGAAQGPSADSEAVEHVSKRRRAMGVLAAGARVHAVPAAEHLDVVADPRRGDAG